MSNQEVLGFAEEALKSIQGIVFSLRREVFFEKLFKKQKSKGKRCPKNATGGGK